MKVIIELPELHQRFKSYFLENFPNSSYESVAVRDLAEFFWIWIHNKQAVFVLGSYNYKCFKIFYADPLESNIRLLVLPKEMQKLHQSKNKGNVVFASNAVGMDRVLDATYMFMKHLNDISRLHLTHDRLQLNNSHVIGKYN